MESVRRRRKPDFCAVSAVYAPRIAGGSDALLISYNGQTSYSRSSASTDLANRGLCRVRSCRSAAVRPPGQWPPRHVQL